MGRRARVSRVLLALALVFAVGGAALWSAIRPISPTVFPRGDATMVAFTPSGDLLIGAAGDLELWRLGTGSCVWSVVAGGGVASVAASVRENVVVWETDRGAMRACSLRDGQAVSVTMRIPDGASFAFGETEWTFLSPELGAVARRGPDRVEVVRTVDTAEGGISPLELVAQGTAAWALDSFNDHLQWRELSSGRVRIDFPVRGTGPWTRVGGAVASRGDRAAQALATCVQVISTDDGRLVVDFRPLSADVAPSARLKVSRRQAAELFTTAPRFSPDGELVAVGRSDGVVNVWHSWDGRVAGELAAREGDSVRALAFSPDGETLTTVQADGKVRLWPLARLR